MPNLWIAMSHPRPSPAVAVLFLALAPAAAALAQTAPDPGALLEQQRQASQPAPPALPAAPAAEAFAGFTSVSGLEPAEEAVLREVEARYRGQAVPARRVLELAARELERRGVTVVLQADARGAVRAVKPVLAAVEVTDERKRPRADLRAMLVRGLQLPGPLDRARLERNATLLNETPGVRAAYRMQPGEQPGQTRLGATLEDGALLSGYVSLDTAGNRQIGRLQATGGLYVDNPLGLGERFSVNALASEHGRYLQGAADFLLHPSGLRGGFGYSSFRYDYSQGAVPFDGEASAATLQASLPLARSEWARTTVTLALDHKRNSGRANRRSLSEWEVDTLSLGLQGQHALPAAVSASYGLNLVQGDASQRNAAAALRDEPFLQQSGAFTKLAFQGRLVRALGQGGLSVALAGAGQVASKNLPGAEKFLIGGAGFMRGREPQLVGGDHAVHAELRLDQEVGASFRVGAFAEAAWLKANATRITAAAYQANTADLVRVADAGLRLSWAAGNGQAELTVARPLDGTPRFMNGAPIEAHTGGSRWVAYARAVYRF